MVFASRVPSRAELHSHYLDYGHAWQDSTITRARYAELLDSFQKFRSVNRLLDFGCGAGFFLEEARSRGWQTYGTEYSGRALQLARDKGLDVLEAPVERHAFMPASFDVITAFEVFEHVSDPNAEAELVARWLRPGGLLYCTTPNFGSLSRRLLRSRWTVIEFPEHLCYFTGRTLTTWLERHGFEKLSLKSSGFSVSRLRCGLGSPTTGPPFAFGDEEIREAIERSATLRTAKSIANAAFSILRTGDTLKGHFVLAAPLRNG
jgi:SAM-dependent methyltransferase